MTSGIVLAGKLRPPEPAGLTRPRLERPLLDDPASRLDLVIAPPGSGKTTLLAHVCAASAVPTAWYQVTAEDATEAALTRHLAQALHDCLGIEAAHSRLGGLLGSLEQWSGTAGMLVLDDLHEILGTPAERALEQFLALRPPALKVLAASRRQPNMNLPRLRVSGAFRETSSDDLRFRSWEVEELFVSVFGEPLPPEAAAALTRRTGGWAAGLQLFHLATAGRSAADRQRAVANLGARSKLIRSYLARNVLSELTEERRLFLLRTCTLGQLTGQLCDALLGTTGSARVLDDLEQRQLFTSSTDDGQTFRYHEVLRTHLELALVDEYGSAGARAWYSRSAELLESAGAQLEAVRAYARAEDWGAVARLIQRAGHGATGAGADVLLPADLLRHDPWLALAEARRHLRRGDVQTSVDAFSHAGSLLDDPDFQGRCRDERALAMTWLGATSPTRGPQLGGNPDRRHWAERVRRATRSGPATPPDVTTGEDAAQRLATGLTALLAGRFGWSAAALDSVASASATDPLHRLLAELAGVVIELIRADCPDPPARLELLAMKAELDSLPWLARLVRGLQTTVLMVAESAPWRIVASSDLLGDCESDGDEWGAALLQLSAAVAGHLGGDPTAGPRYDAAAARFTRLDAPVLAVWAQALHVAFLARLDPDPAIGFAHDVLSTARSLRVRGAQVLTYAALATAHGAATDEAGTDGAGARAWAVAREIAVECDLPLSVLLLFGPREAAPAGHGRVPVAAPPQLQLTCFGGFRLTVGGRAVDPAPLRPRARALLRLLALWSDREIHRERLIDALWPGVEVSVAAHRLQVAVSSVRQLLEHAGLAGSDVLARHGEAYRLCLPPGAAVDVGDFERLLREAGSHAARGDVPSCQAAREAALELYVGELLPEDGPAEYVVADRERLRLVAAAAAAALAEDNRALGRRRAALAAAHRSLELDPFHDLSWRLLIELYEAEGDLIAAERTRHEQARVRAELAAPEGRQLAVSPQFSRR